MMILQIDGTMASSAPANKGNQFENSSEEMERKKGGFVGGRINLGTNALVCAGIFSNTMINIWVMTTLSMLAVSIRQY